MAERFLSARTRPETPTPFSLVNSVPLRIGPERSRAQNAAERTLDGEDRSEIMRGEGKGGIAAGAFSAAPGRSSEPSRRDKYRR